MKLNRRDFLRTTVLAGVIGGTSAVSIAGEPIPVLVQSANPLIDVNVSLSRCPFRRLPLDDTSALVARLKRANVKQAWAGSFDGLLHKDMASANTRLAKECQAHGRGFLIPFGTINPKLPDWRDDLRQIELHRMPGIRLFPNYHGYKLNEPVFKELLVAAAERGLVVQLAVSMEDERMQHPLARVAEVDLAALPGIVAGTPFAKVVLLNWFRAAKGELLERLARWVSFDIATVEGVAGIETLLAKIPADRILFGSHAPFYYFESALLKMRESEFTAEQARLIGSVNARRLMS